MPSFSQVGVHTGATKLSLLPGKPARDSRLIVLYEPQSLGYNCNYIDRGKSRREMGVWV